MTLFLSKLAGVADQGLVLLLGREHEFLAEFPIPAALRIQGHGPVPIEVC